MKIKLEYYLKRKRITLKDFLKINKLTSYKDLLTFCKIRNFVPIEVKEFNELNETKKYKKQESAGREASKTQKKKSIRGSRKSKPTPQKLPNSTDKKQD